MEFLMGVLKAVPSHMGIDLGRGDAAMAEHFLDDAKVGAVFEEVGSEAMSQHVGCNIALDACEACTALYAEPERH